MINLFRFDDSNTDIVVESLDDVIAQLEQTITILENLNIENNYGYISDLMNTIDAIEHIKNTFQEEVNNMEEPEESEEPEENIDETEKID